MLVLSYCLEDCFIPVRRLITSLSTSQVIQTQIYPSVYRQLGTPPSSCHRQSPVYYPNTE